MAASDKVLGNLHAKVAAALTEQVEGYIVQEEDGEKLIKPSPALLGAAIAFLKNNNITADVEDNAALRDLGAALKARRQKRLPQAALDEAAESFVNAAGGSMMQ